jgi:hypothetical protein
LLFPIKAATIAGAIAARPAIELPMNPAKIGIINVKAAPPIILITFSGPQGYIPEFGSFGSAKGPAVPALGPQIALAIPNEKARQIPPRTITGIMYEIPARICFITLSLCLTSNCPTSPAEP